MKYASRNYESPNLDLKHISNLALGFFKEEGFVTQRFEKSNEHIIQARKGGILRALLSTSRAITVVLNAHNNTIAAYMGISEWIDGSEDERKRMIGLSIEKLFLETQESLWAYEIEHHLWNHLETNIEIS